MIVDTQEKVSKEAHELAEGIANTVLSIQKALSDGWQPGQDLPIILNAVLLDLVPKIQGIEKLGSEKEENLEAFVTAFLLPVKKLAFRLFKKTVVPV
jgi:hypothetical protein